MTPEERLFRALISDIVLELTASETNYRHQQPRVANEFKLIRHFILDSLAAIPQIDHSIVFHESCNYMGRIGELCLKCGNRVESAPKGK